jgi:hypothetical protein
MKKKFLLIGATAVIVAAGLIYYSVSKGKQNQGKENNQAVGVENPSGEYSINELLTINKPLKCTWKESTTGDKDVTNIIYISGKKFYQDVTMSDIGHSFTISDGDYLYIWNDFNEMASKMKNSEIKTSAVPGQEKTKETTGQEQKRNFVCEKWTVDASIFIPPTNKNFKDITEEMNQAVQNLQQNSDEYKKQACDSCRNAPTQELIDSCLENMQCE